MEEIHITADISIPMSELRFEFVRSSGPGGQNVNKVATAVQLRFDVANSPSLPDNVRERLAILAGKRMTGEGVLVLDARRHRTQEQNRADAVERFSDLVKKATETPKPRRETKPSASSERRRLDSKRKRGQTKQFRKKVDGEEE